MARTAIVTRQDAVLLGGWPVAHQARGSVITVRVCVPGFITGALLLTDRLAPLAVWLRHEEPADLPAPLPAATSATADTTAVVPNRSPPAGHRRVPPDLTNTLRAAWARVRLVAGEHDREPSDDDGKQRRDVEEGLCHDVGDGQEPLDQRQPPVEVLFGVGVVQDQVDGLLVLGRRVGIGQQRA